MLGDRIREMRKKHRFSQKQLADALGVSQTAVSSWEKGIREPDLDTIGMIADVCGESHYDLLFDKTPEQSKKVDWEEERRLESHYSDMFDLIESAEYAADIALFRKLEKVPDQFLLDEIIERFHHFNKAGKYKLYKAAKMLENELNEEMQEGWK